MFKKMVLFSLIMVFLYTAAAFGTGITFTFANKHITGTSPKYYEFDVMAAAGAAGTKIGDGMVYINYNTAGFGSSVKENNKITVTAGTLTQGNYLIFVNDKGPSMVAITAEYIGASGAGNDLPANATQWVHVKIEIANQSETSGLSFEQSSMIDQQYESDRTKYSPVVAIDTLVFSAL